MSYGSVNIMTTATQIVDANTQRLSLILQNVGSRTIYIGGDSGVSTLNSVALSPLDVLSEEDTPNRMYMGAYYGIVATGSDYIRYWERTGTN